MPHHDFFWTNRAIEKVGDNGLTTYDVEHAVRTSKRRELSSTGRPAYRGRTPGGELIFVVFEEIDELLISVVTAFRIERNL